MDSQPFFKCPHSDCGKIFKRQVHLTRHERGHDPGNIFICTICRKEFNRKDSLQRHVVLHGEAIKLAPTGRAKRACIGCHAGKVRCDGNDQCSRCIKKNIECVYLRQDDDTLMGESSEEPEVSSISGSAMPQESIEIQNRSLIDRDADMTNDPNHEWSSHFDSRTSKSSTLGGATEVRQITASPVLPPPVAPKARGLVDWLATRIEKDCPAPPVINKDQELTSQTSRNYVDAYFSCFHHTWPIVHRPSIDESSNSLLIPAIKMIGAWCFGTAESKEYAVSIHNGTTDQIFLQLYKVTSEHIFQESLSNDICVAALLNVIFSIHYGNPEAISRASILRNVLVGALREVGFFSPGRSWPDERPGYFLPMRLIKLGQRQRLSSCLFKVDAYLSLLRGQPPLVTVGELHFTLPSTFSSWTADGLHVWEKRQLAEPQNRVQTPQSTMIFTIISDVTPTFNSHVLIEDIHSCFCATYSDVSRLWLRRGNPKESGIIIAAEEDALKNRLDALRAKIDLVTNHFVAGIKSGQDVQLLYQYYIGFEDQSTPGWQTQVTSRVRCLLLNIDVFYHLISISLFTDLKTLTQIAQDQSPKQEPYASQLEAAAKRQVWAQVWATSPGGRRSLAHAFDILIAQQNNLRSNGILPEQVDPMSHIALSVVALVFWAFCTFYDKACDTCVMSPVGVLDMTVWSKEEKEAWVAMPYICRPSIQGIQLCPCNSGFLSQLIRPCIPESWSVPNMIAPGILKVYA